MFAFALPLLSSLWANIKWVVIGLLIIVVAFGAWRYTKLVENYAIAKQTISQLEQNIKDKETALKLERDLAKLSDSIIEKLEEDKNKLADEIEQAAKNLPTDSNDLAPASIRQTIKNLQAIQ